MIQVQENGQWVTVPEGQGLDLLDYYKRHGSVLVEIYNEGDWKPISQQATFDSTKDYRISSCIQAKAAPRILAQPVSD